MAGEDKLRDLVRTYTDCVRTWRRKIHEIPELSGEEVETAALVVSALQGLHVEVTSQAAGGNGVLVVLHGRNPGRTIALRADMDALSIEEKTGLSFASQHPGKMHACGHDAHVAMLLGAVHVLHDMRNQFDGTIKFIFQPAEEKSPEGGAKNIVASGFLDDVDAIYGLHVWPTLRTGEVGVRTGPVMAASDHVSIQIVGKPSHAAMPHRGIDAIAAAGQCITAAQNIISRQINPLHPAVLTFGKISGGSRYNIVADTVDVEGTCRTYHKETQDAVEMHLKQILKGIDAAFGTTSRLQYDRGYDAVFNSTAQAALAAAVVTERFGHIALADVPEPAMTAEDFSGYLKVCAGAFLWLGVTAEEAEIYPLHNACFSVDENSLPIGVELLSALALSALKQK